MTFSMTKAAGRSRSSTRMYFAEEIVPLVLFGDVSDLPLRPRAPDQRIGLAGRAADQDGVVGFPAQRTDGMIDGGGSRFRPEFEALRSRRCRLPRRRIHLAPVGLRDQSVVEVDEGLWQRRDAPDTPAGRRARSACDAPRPPSRPRCRSGTARGRRHRGTQSPRPARPGRQTDRRCRKWLANQGPLEFGLQAVY